jgi:hypothetical protein
MDGCAIFSRIWEDERQFQEIVTSTGLRSCWSRHFQLTLFLNQTSHLLDAPFSTEYAETSEIEHIFITIGCAIFN